MSILSILNKIDEWATLAEQKSEQLLHEIEALQKAQQARKLAYELEEAKRKLPQKYVNYYAN